MTNKFLLLAAVAGTVAFASCQNEGNAGMSDEMMQAKVDSAVNARMAEMQAQLAAQNDSLINAMAMMKADSMMAAMNAGRGGTSTRPTSPSRPTTTVPSKPATVGNGKPVIGNNNKPGTVGNGKPAIGNAGEQKDNTVGNGKPKIGGN